MLLKAGSLPAGGAAQPVCPICESTRSRKRSASRLGGASGGATANVSWTISRSEGRIAPRGRSRPTSLPHLRINPLKETLRFPLGRGERRGHRKRLLDDLHVPIAQDRARNRHARRRQLLLDPLGFARQRERDPGAKARVVTRIVVEQTAIFADQRLLPVVGQANSGLPRRGRI